MMNYKVFVSRFVLLLLLCCVGISHAMDAKVLRLRGTVLLDGEPLTKTTDISKGQILECVGKMSFVQIMLSDGSSFLLRNGKMIIKEINKEGSLLKLIRGIIFNSVNHREGQRYTIETPTGAMAVRGTKFYAEADAAKTYLCVCEGVVNFSNSRGAVDVKIFQDLHVVKDEKLEVKPSTEVMWKQAKSGFELMGIEIAPLPNK